MSTTTSTVETPAAFEGPDEQALARRKWRYLRALRSPRGLFGLSLFTMIVLISVIGPFLITQTAVAQGPDALVSPNHTHWLGTDELGRDLFARVLVGTRVDLAVTLIAVPIAGIAGTLLGLLGVVTRLGGAFFQRFFDVLLGVPAVILGIGVGNRHHAGIHLGRSSDHFGYNAEIR